MTRLVRHALSAVVWMTVGLTAGAQCSNDPTCDAAIRSVSTQSINNVFFADRFAGADAGAKISACLQAATAAGGICDARGMSGPGLKISSDIFAGVAGKAGKLIFGESVFVLTVTQDVPANWTIEGVYGSYQDGGQLVGGTIFQWSGPPGVPVIKYFNTEFTKTAGIMVDCTGVAGTTGVLVDSSNVPATSHDNRFEDIDIRNCAIGMQWGTSGAKGYQSDGILLQNFKFYNHSTAYLRIDSQNAGQGSVIERGFFQNPLGNAVPMIDLRYSPLNFSVRNVAFGAGTGYTGAGINIEYPITSGGAPLYIEACVSEIPATGYFLRVLPRAKANTTIVMIANSIGPGKVEIQSAHHVVSIGNQFATTNATATANLTDVTSIGDFFQPGSGWVMSNGARLLSINAVDGNGAKSSGMRLASINYGTLSAISPPNGTMFYCPDCTHGANPCVANGTGAIAKRLNATWVCN
jgi:hypothetical protein